MLTSRKLDWKSISVVAVVGRMFYIPPRPHYTVDKKNQWEERLKGWEKVKWKYVFQVGRIWDFFWWKWFWMINECEMKNLYGLCHKKIMAFCQIDINHGPRIAFYVLPFSVKKSYKFSCCHCFFLYICEAYLLIGWILLIQDSLFLTLLYTFAWKLIQRFFNVDKKQGLLRRRITKVKGRKQ